ncbi:MAG: hypothetical protein R2940_16545 [Syntrophotaleaceae bacterium]
MCGIVIIRLSAGDFQGEKQFSILKGLAGQINRKSGICISRRKVATLLSLWAASRTDPFPILRLFVLPFFSFTQEFR